jgi:hypothetical protein
MRMMQKVRLVLGAVLLAWALYALAAAPGFVSDLASTVPMRPVQETLR